MKNKKLIITITMIFILVIIFAIYILMFRPQNDLAVMEKLISKHIKTNQSVTIYNATHINNHRLMSYILIGQDKYQGVGYAHFKINDKSKYELLNVFEPDEIIEKASDITIYEFSNLIIDEVPINKRLFIISNNPELSRIERIMENGEIRETEVNTNPISEISFFNDLDDNYTVEYNFYNKNGDIIK